jgi:hypothetical protein
MKYAWMLGLVMVPYGSLVPQSPGNPNGDGYIGQPNSVYDSAANPAKTVGTVSYNPYAPLPAADTAVPAPGMPLNSPPAR